MAKEGATILYEGQDPVTADVVFVHGLRGHAHETWSKGSVCWPKDLLSKDLPHLRIIRWGYDADVAAFSSFTNQSGIVTHAENLLGDIVRRRRTDREEERPLIFVGHSLGGLVIKQALIRASEYYHNRQDQSLGALYTCTCGVVFVGTPHRGSDKASLGHFIARIAGIALRSPNKKLLDSLERDSEILEGQRKSFDSITESMPIACLYEEKPTKGLTIVPQDSACMDGFRVRPIGIPNSHMDMCKFADSNDIGYQRTSGYLISLVKDVEKRKKEVERKVATRLLKSLGFETIDHRHDDINQAHKDTFKWIRKNNGFMSWLQNKQRLYWLKGKPGSGKSALMKYIFHDPEIRDRLTRTSSTSDICFAGFFFHDRGSPLQKSSLGLLRAILRQVLQRFERLIPIILPSRWEELMSAPKAENSFQWSLQELQRAFDVLINQDETQFKLCLFIDGLDEYSGDHEHIADFLKGITGVSQTRLARSIEVQVCVSSRPLTVFNYMFHGLPNLRLEDHTSNDIRRYVEDKLGAYSLVDTEHLIENIVTKASGVFLWVKLVVDSLRKGLRDGDGVTEIQARLDETSPDLEGLYQQIIKKIDQRYRAHAAQLFLMLGAALQPLSLWQMVLADKGPEHAIKRSLSYGVPVAKKEAECQQMLKRINSRCLGLLEIRIRQQRGEKDSIRNATVQYLHQSAKEFLTKPGNMSVLETVPGPLFDEHLSLASSYLSLLKDFVPQRYWRGWADLSDQFEDCIGKVKLCSSPNKFVAKMKEEYCRTQEGMRHNISSLIKYVISSRRLIAEISVYKYHSCEELLSYVKKEAEGKRLHWEETFCGFEVEFRNNDTFDQLDAFGDKFTKFYHDYVHKHDDDSVISSPRSTWFRDSVCRIFDETSSLTTSKFTHKYDGEDDNATTDNDGGAEGWFSKASEIRAFFDAPGCEIAMLCVLCEWRIKSTRDEKVILLDLTLVLLDMITSYSLYYKQHVRLVPPLPQPAVTHIPNPRGLMQDIKDGIVPHGDMKLERLQWSLKIILLDWCIDHSQTNDSTDSAPSAALESTSVAASKCLIG